MRISDWSSDVCSSDLRSRYSPSCPEQVRSRVEISFEVGPDYPAARRRTRTTGRKWLALKPVRHRPMPPACPLKNKVVPMKKAVFAILLSTAAIVAGPVACSQGDQAEMADDAYTVGTELGISKAAMDTRDRKSTRLNSSH